MNSVIDSALPQSKSLSDYLEVLNRYRNMALIVSASALLVTVVIALAWPPIYRSTATILIEQQEIPSELVRSTVSTYADQRIQIINQRVMTRANLMGIIMKYNLYPKARRREPMEKVIDDMRDDIRLKTVSADVVDPRNGQPTQATIAFTLSYGNESPLLAQKVANELTTLFLDVNLTTRREIATQASDFLTDEANHVSDQISNLEGQLAKFKSSNMDTMPGMLQFNMQSSQRVEQELMDVEQNLRSLKERRIYLESQLAQINPNGALYSESGERILGPAERLKALRASYVSLSGIYSSDHPDLIRMRKQISSLEAEVGKDTTSSSKDLKESLTSTRGELAESRKRYGEDHPTVQRLEHQVTVLEQAIDKKQRQSDDKTIVTKDVDNPAYIQTQAELQTVISQANSLEKKQSELNDQLHDIDKLVDQSPVVEQKYQELTREYDNAWTKYKELKAKQLEAKLAQSLESEQKGERFSLIDPPLLPEEPSSPNRLAIGVLGSILSVAAGLGTIVVREGIDGTVRGIRDITSIINMVPLVGIPYIETEEDIRQRTRRKRLIVMAAVLILCGAILIEHIFFVPLDVLWFTVLRQF